MLQEGGVHPGVRTLEALRHAAALYARSLDPVELLERLGLGGLERRTYRQLSGGEQRRLALALVANAEEDATAESALFRGKRRILRTRTTVKAYRSRVIRVKARFRPGRYTLRVTLRASLNPARTSSFSAPLRITR